MYFFNIIYKSSNIYLFFFYYDITDASFKAFILSFLLKDVINDNEEKVRFPRDAEDKRRDF